MSQSFIITANADYHIANVLVDSVSVGNLAIYEFMNVTGNHTISASFAINSYTVTFAEGSNGTITGTKNQTVGHGSNCSEVTAVPDANYRFVNWTVESAGGNPENVEGSSARLMKNVRFSETDTEPVSAVDRKAMADSSEKVEYVRQSHRGSYYSTSNPLTVANVTSNMEITANFARCTAKIEMAVYPQDSGTTAPAETTVVDIGTHVSINAIPADGYYFVNWSVTAGATVAETNSANTSAIMTGDSTLTAVFAKDAPEFAEFKKVSVKISDSKKNTDSVSILEGGIPDSLSEKDFDINNFRFTISVDSFEEVLSNENGQLLYKANKRLYTFKPDKSVGKKGAFSISLADGKRYWNFRESGLDLSEKLDNFDGLEIYLAVNEKTFGSILDMDEANLHKFSKNANNYKELSVAGEEFDAFSVAKAEGKVFNYKPFSDSFKINDGQMRLPDGCEFSANDAVTLLIDDAEFIADNPSAWKISRTTAVYRAVSENGGMTILFNLKKNTWRAKVEKADLSSYLYHNDGIEIHLIVGDCEGAATINADTSTFLNYDNELVK